MADGNGASLTGKPSKTGVKAASNVSNLIDTFMSGLGGLVKVSLVSVTLNNK